MEKIEIEIHKPSEKLPNQSDIVLAWTILLTAERCKFLDGNFYISNGKSWVDIPLEGVKYWSELPQIEELKW